MQVKGPFGVSAPGGPAFIWQISPRWAAAGVLLSQTWSRRNVESQSAYQEMDASCNGKVDSGAGAGAVIWRHSQRGSSTLRLRMRCGVHMVARAWGPPLKR